MNLTTNQEIFDTVARHLLTQNEKSRAKNIKESGAEVFECSYRGENGLMCAVGCLITDDAYSPQLEGFGATTAYVLKALEESGVVHANSYDVRHLLRDLQFTHDTFHPDAWRSTLQQLAERHDLNWNFEP